MRAPCERAWIAQPDDKHGNTLLEHDFNLRIGQLRRQGVVHVNCRAFNAISGKKAGDERLMGGMLAPNLRANRLACPLPPRKPRREQQVHTKRPIRQ